MGISSRKDFINKTQKIAHYMGVNGLVDQLEAEGIDLSEENLAFKMIVIDKSMVDWKPKAHFVKVFEMEMKRLLKNKILDVHKIGFLTVLSVNIDYQDNSLRNDDGTYMSQKDIIDATGLSRKHVSNILKELINDKIMFTKKQEDNKRFNKYYINPNLFFRGKQINKELWDVFSNFDIVDESKVGE